MSSTDLAAAVRPWQFFLVVSLVASSAAILLARDTHPAALVLVSVVVCSAGLVGLGVYRTLAPLVGGESLGWRAFQGGGARARIEREKQLILRSIKELEFDRAMRKVGDRDFNEMRGRLRRRALGLMAQLDALGDRGGSAGASSSRAYRAAIERDLAELLGAELLARDDTPPTAARSCVGCGTRNDPDARFCKSCGHALAL